MSASGEFARRVEAEQAPRAPAAEGAPESPARLAALADRLRTAAPDIGPQPAFRAALRGRLLAVAAVGAAEPAPAPARRRPRLGLGLTIGATASVVAVAVVVVAVGTRSLPGQPLYGVKRAGEGLALLAAAGPLERGTVHLDHAAERLDEVARLMGRDDVFAAPAGRGQVAAGGRTGLVLGALDDMDSDTRTAWQLLGASGAPVAAATVQALTTFSVRQDRALVSLVPLLPLAARQRVGQSVALVEEVDAGARSLRPAALPPGG